MEPLDKFETILEGLIKEKKKEVEAARKRGMHPGEAYIQGLEHELIGLKKACFIPRAIRNNAFASDEVIEKRWKPKLTE